MNQRNCFLFALLYATLVVAAPPVSQPVFWESELALALDMKDSSYRAAGIDSTAFAALPVTETPVAMHLSSPSLDTASPWFYFLSGIACIRDSADAAAKWFARAVTASEKNPGMALALALEFGRCNQDAWQDKCLKKLSTLFLVSGAQSAPLVSQALLFRAFHQSAAAKGSTVRSRDLLTWASDFDRHCLWPAVIGIQNKLAAFNIPAALFLVKELAAKVSSSWSLQLELARQWYVWLLALGVFLVFGTLFGICVKYLPQALHSFSERLSDAYNLRSKLALTLVMYVSLLFLGVLPFVWISIFIVWRHLKRGDKMVAAVAVVCVMCYPLCLRLDDMLTTCCAPGGPVMMFRKSIDEGYYPALDSSITSLVRTKGGAPLARTAAAVLNLKKGDVAAASLHVRAAAQATPDDPAVIVTAGNALYFAGDLAGARNAFQQCVTLFPGFEPAYFNLGQYYFNSMETAKGMEYITKASKLNPLSINAFIKTNDESFSKDWPLIRQLCQPDYSPSYFWKNIFFRYGGSWATTNARFGADFLGMQVLPYSAVSIFLLVMLLILDAFVWSRDTVRKIYNCKLCQTPICRKCKRGGICQDCFNSTQHIRNENIRQRIMAKIQFRSARFHGIVAAALDALFPGSGMLYAGSSAYRLIPLLLASSIVYGTYFALASPSLVYPGWLLRGMAVPLCGMCLLYNAFFVGLFCVRLLRKLKPRGE